MTSVTVTTVLNGYLVSRENAQGHEEIRVALDAQGLADAIKAFGGPVFVGMDCSDPSKEPRFVFNNDTWPPESYGWAPDVKAR